MKSIQNEIGVKSLIKRTESSLFEFLSVKTLSKKITVAEIFQHPIVKKNKRNSNNSISRHLQKCLYKGLCSKLSTNQNPDRYRKAKTLCMSNIFLNLNNFKRH